MTGPELSSEDTALSDFLDLESHFSEFSTIKSPPVELQPANNEIPTGEVSPIGFRLGDFTSATPDVLNLSGSQYYPDSKVRVRRITARIND